MTRRPYDDRARWSPRRSLAMGLAMALSLWIVIGAVAYAVATTTGHR